MNVVEECTINANNNDSQFIMQLAFLYWKQIQETNGLTKFQAEHDSLNVLKPLWLRI